MSTCVCVCVIIICEIFAYNNIYSCLIDLCLIDLHHYNFGNTFVTGTTVAAFAAVELST